MNKKVLNDMLKIIKSSPKRIYLFALLSMIGITIQAQTFEIVKEINTTSTIGSISNPGMATVGNNVLFFSDDGINGQELWRTDGTSAGTQRLTDILPGAFPGIGASPQSAVGNGVFYFAASDASELWRSDGTEAGTYLLKFFGGTNRVSQMFYHNGVLFFVANDGINGIEPWISDGTVAGTVLLKDINAGPANSLSTTVSSYGFIAMGSQVFFAATTASNGRELWKTDGTTAGTLMVKDVNPGAVGSINNMKAAVHNGKVYFAANNGTLGIELWATDGTDAGTYLVRDISTGSGNASPNNLISFNGSLFFSASNNNNNTPGLWKTDGTSAGTVLVRDLAADGISLTVGFNNTTNSFTVNGNKLYFRGGLATESGLFASDGTTAGTALVKAVGGTGGLFSFNGLLYFQGAGPESSNFPVLYRSDGTAAGTLPVFEGDLLSGLSVVAPQNLPILNNKLFFVGGNQANGNELWSTDGTSAGTNLVKDINLVKAGTQTGSQSIGGSAFLNGMFLFSAADDTHGVELWKTDGTSEGTVMIKDIFSGSGSSNPSQFCVVGDQAFFIANNGITGNELWKTDGTTAGTQMVKDINPGFANGAVGRLTASGSYVYFLATHPETGTEMWRSNGTEAGTTLVSDLTAGISSGFSNTNTHLTYLNKAFYIHIPSLKLYVADGPANTFTEFSTNIVAAYDMAVVGNSLFIGGRNASGQSVLWRSDNGGAPVQIKVVRNTDLGSDMYQFANCNGKLYFNANDGTTGNEPWVSDGTEAGTFRLKDIQAGAGTSQPFSFTASGNKVFFQAGSTGTDAELWVTDGTEAGTYLVKDINPGVTGSFPNAFLAIPGGKVLFTANDGAHGIELWQSNATEAGTTMVKDFNEIGNGFNNVLRAFHFKENNHLWPLNDGVLFFARNAEKGQQLYFGSIEPGVFYVNDSSTTGDTLTTAIGNDNNPGTAEAPFATIQKAVQEAGDGSIIYVDAGSYVEQVTIDKGLTIMGAGRQKTLVTLPDSTAPAPGDFLERGTFQTTAGIADLHISDLSATGRLSVGFETITPVIIQGGGSVRNCNLQGGNQGIFFRVPSGIKTALAENNIIGAEYIGINFEGSGITGSMINNSVTVFNSGFSAGVFGNGPLVKFTATGNTISNYVTQGFSVNGNSTLITQNSIMGRGGVAIQSGSAVSATCNWFGSADATDVAAAISGNITYTPWLLNGTDADTLAIGFQPVADACFGGRAFYVNDNSTAGDVFTTAAGNDANPGNASAPFATITHAFDVAPSGSAIFVDAGLYDFAGTQSFLSKPISFFGANYQISPNSSSNALQTNEERNAETIVKGLLMNLQSPNLSFKGFTFDPGNASLVLLSNNAQSSNDFGGFTFEKNILKITHTSNNIPQILLTGKFTDTGFLPITSGFSISDNRFEKTNGSNGITIQLNFIKNADIHNNAFVVTGSVTRTQTALSLGSNSGVVDSISFTKNRIDQANTMVGGNRIAHLMMKENQISNSSNLFASNNSFAGSTEIILENNQGDNTTGGTPFILYNRTGPALNSTYNRFQLNNNNFTGTPLEGIDFQLFGNLILTVNNVVPNMQTLITGNTFTYSGNFSDVQNQYIRPVTLRGNVGKADIRFNEMTLNNSGTMLPTPAGLLLPANPAITIGPDNGPAAFMTGNAEINIHNNKIQGYKQGVVVYDVANNGRDAFTGYGNLPGGTTFNVSNNSFVGDSISINNGDSSQIINAGCNWFGTANAAMVANKISSNTVRFTPFLINGNNLSETTGFHPASGSCASITGFSPAEGMEGAVVVISGEGLSGATSVSFNGKASNNISATSDSTLVATVPQGATTGTVAVTTPLGTVVSAINFFVIPSPAADSIGVCPGSNGLLISQIKGATYQWQELNGGTYVDITDGQHFLGTTKDTLRLLEIPTDWNGRSFRCLVNDVVNNKSFTLQVANYWSGGGSNTSWSNPLNWGCSGQVPDENTNVIISSGAVILTEAATAKSIWVSPGASFTVQPGVVLTINQQ
jgi:ELWxxDGT repeat protein